MSSIGWVIALFAAVATGIVAVVWRPTLVSFRESRFSHARRQFHRQREYLEARFLHLATASGRASRLRWEECEFADDVTYARDRHSRKLCAFVAVTMAYDTGADMMNNGGLMGGGSTTDLRSATAVFHLAHGRWNTYGRTVFDLNPTEAVIHFKDHFVMLGQELAHRP